MITIHMDKNKQYVLSLIALLYRTFVAKGQAI